MKYFSFIILALTIQFFAGAQTLSDYQRYKTVPVARFLSADSTGYELKAKLDKDKKLLVVLFSPECDHCKHETTELIQNIDKFKDIQIVMAMPAAYSLQQMKDFINTYNLSNYKNIIVGKDIGYVLPPYYNVKNLPFHAFYDKNKKLIAGYEGTMSVTRILQTFDFIIK